MAHVCHAVAHMPQLGAARRWQTWHMCATQWHTWRKLGQHAGGRHGACVPRSGTHGANWGSTQVADMAHVCHAVAHMAQTGAARRWQTWHVCATEWHTWRKLGKHAGGRHGTCVPRSGTHGANWGSTDVADNGANWGSTQVADMAHVCH